MNRHALRGRFLHPAAVGAACLLAGLQAGSAFADVRPAARALADLSLEELSEIQVFSASRHLEPTHGTPSAIFVLTGEDLHRAGVTSIPDALRLVPGVQVGRVDANKWAVSMRGFNSREANKLLVLVDGRSIYDPLFSGMLWESHDVLLEDVERIEVIRGPGGTLWGANAFNGVINIITRNAADTTGTFASLTAGDEERYIAALRHGWATSDNASVRLYLKARERDTGYLFPEEPVDASRDVRGGLRWDWRVSGNDEVRISADVFDATAGIRETPAQAHEVQHEGHNLLGRWTHQASPERELRLQVYYDHVGYESIGFTQNRDTYDLEFQQRLQSGERHLLVWGAGYRRTRDDVLSSLSGFVDVLPARRDDTVQTLFLQDAVEIAADKLQLTLGIKFEDTDYADAQWLPNLRLAYTPTKEQTWWAAVSEATRVPSRLEADLTFFNSIRIGDSFQAEDVRAYEAGFRQLVSPELWLDLALFRNDYEDLLTTEANGMLRNFMSGHSEGAELAVRWEPLAQLRVDGSYTFLDMDLELHSQSTSRPEVPALQEGLAPRHQFSIRTMVELTDEVELDATARFVDRLSSLDFPAYTQLDVALHFRPWEDFEVSIVGSNLLDSHQPEQAFISSATGMATEVERGVYARVAWRR
jgi:iron complex outermembrane recepter protein